MSYISPCGIVWGGSDPEAASGNKERYQADGIARVAEETIANGVF